MAADRRDHQEGTALRVETRVLLSALFRGGRARADSAHTNATDPASPRAAQRRRLRRQRPDRESDFCDRRSRQ